MLACHRCSVKVSAKLILCMRTGESAGLRVPPLDRTSAHFAAHSALHRNDIARPAGVFLEDGDTSDVAMARWTAPEASQVVKGVKVKRRGIKPHASSLTSLEGQPDFPGQFDAHTQPAPECLPSSMVAVCPNADWDANMLQAGPSCCTRHSSQGMYMQNACCPERRSLSERNHVLLPILMELRIMLLLAGFRALSIICLPCMISGIPQATPPQFPRGWGAPAVPTFLSC